MKELARQIQKNPENVNQLLDSYKTDSKEVRDFLNSLKTVVVYVVPALLEAFSVKHYDENAPVTLRKLMSDKSYINALFVDQDGVGWTYTGISTNGLANCRANNCDINQEFDPDTQIKWLF